MRFTAWNLALGRKRGATILARGVAAIHVRPDVRPMFLRRIEAFPVAI